MDGLDSGDETESERSTSSIRNGSRSRSESSSLSNSSQSPTSTHLTPHSSSNALFDAFTPRRSEIQSPISIFSTRDLLNHQDEDEDEMQIDDQEEEQEEEEEIHLRLLENRKKKMLDALHDPNRKSTKNIYSRCQSDFRKWCKEAKVSELVDESEYSIKAEQEWEMRRRWRDKI